MRLAIRRATSESDILLAIAEGDKLHWNIAPREAPTFIAGGGAFYVGESSITDKSPVSPVAWISAAQYPIVSPTVDPLSSSYAHVSFFLVREDMRRHGFGSQMWQHMLQDTRAAAMGSHVTYGLDSVADLVPHYTTKGFKKVFTLPLYSFPAAVVAAVNAPLPDGTQIVAWFAPPNNVGSVSYDDIAAYDSVATGIDRRQMLAAHAAGYGAVARAVVRDSDGAIVGIAVGALESDGGCEISPLIADSPSIARALLAAVALEWTAADAKITMWPPSTNSAATALCVDVGGEVVFEGLHRMSDGVETGARNVERVYSILSPEYS